MSQLAALAASFRGRSELQKRVLIGVPGAILLVLWVWFGGWLGIAILAAGVSLGMAHEFAQISLALPDRQEKGYALLLLAWLAAAGHALMPDAAFELLALSLLALFAYFLATAKRYEGPEFSAHFKELMFSLFGLVYLAYLPLFIVKIHGSASGSHWTILFLLIVWAGDSAAYFGGKRWGRTKLYPHISPKKTREGAAAGLAAGLVVTLLYKLLFFKALSWGGVLLVPLAVGAVSQVGDLCESFLKRAFDKKDSGSILPGHGGFLDRFDGVVFSAPVMYACVKIFS